MLIFKLTLSLREQPVISLVVLPRRKIFYRRHRAKDKTYFWKLTFCKISFFFFLPEPRLPWWTHCEVYPWSSCVVHRRIKAHISTGNILISITSALFADYSFLPWVKGFYKGLPPRDGKLSLVVTYPTRHLEISE